MINGLLLKDMFRTGAAMLEKNKEELNSLNVFPVPDGDTGANMTMTLISALKEVEKVEDDSPVSVVAKAFSSGALRGARGNSGVILSQLLRGFEKGCDGKTELDVEDFINCFTLAVEAAYKAVMKPKEGTILTVAREASEAGTKALKDDATIFSAMDKIIEGAQIALRKTPELLPVLKEAGVVDSGGKGFIYLLLGFKMAMDGEPVLNWEPGTKSNLPDVRINGDIHYDLGEIEFAYCTEFLIKNLLTNVTEEEIEKLRTRFDKMGDSVVVVGDKDLIKVHVHTNTPGKALMMAQRLGELSSIKIENMKEQHTSILENAETEKAQKPKKQKPFALISISSGKGMKGIMEDLGVDYVIEGGQSMNPSIEDIVNAINEVPSNVVYVMPNNKNILLAADQAAKIVEKTAIIIPTTTIPQGIASIIAFNPESTTEQNEQRMREAISSVKSGAITFAVRDSNLNDLDIKKGDVLGQDDDGLVCKGSDVKEVALQLLEKMMDEDTEIITLFYGNDTKESEAEELKELLESKYPDCEFTAYNGGQPLYYYLISVE